MSNIEGTNIQAQGRTSRSRRRRISLAIAGVVVVLVAGTVVIGTQANGSRSGSLLSADCNGVNYTIKNKGPWSDFINTQNLATPAQIEALNQCQQFGKWVLGNGELTDALTEITGFFWAPDKTWCQVSYYSMGSNYKETFCPNGKGRGDHKSYAIVIG